MEIDPPVGREDHNAPMEIDPPLGGEDQNTPMEIDPPVSREDHNTPMETDPPVGREDHNTPMEIDPPEQNSSMEAETYQALDTLCQILEDEEILQRRNYVTSLLEICYARHLMPLVKQLASNDCSGCLIDHPSQKEHDICVMTEFPFQLEMYLDPALAMLEENVVLGTWFEYLAKLHPKVRYYEISQYLDTHWRWDVWINDDWKANMTMLLIDLEDNPYCFEYLIPY